MRLPTCRITLWNSALYFLLLLTLNVRFTDGLTWTEMPSQINKCIGQTANLSWKFVIEPSEEVRQLQWLFNRTQVIAYWSGKQGFHVHVKYQGRVERSAETGILIHNLSTNDIGNYTLYPLIAWESGPNIQSVWLNVIEPTTEHWCTCEKLLEDLRSGQMLNLEGKSCMIQINSSMCCVKGPTTQHCESDPHTSCVPINLPKRTTQCIIVTEQTGSGPVCPHTTKEDPNKVSSSQASAFRPCEWNAVVAMIVLKFVLGF